VSIDQTRDGYGIYSVSETKPCVVALLATPNLDPERALSETRALCDTLGVTVADTHMQRRAKPVSRTLLGSGSLDELHGKLEAAGGAWLVFANDLTPTQLRNLEEMFETRVIDRTQLILDIFAKRAHSREGKLQVELARLSYLLPRVTGWGIVMSRLGGGIATRGPGETKLETEKRRIKERVADLRRELEQIRKRRRVQRKARRRLPALAASIVGYTSAGKSTLLNALSGSEIPADPMLFSTLDPTTRSVELEDGGAVLLTDTVGFISNLPHSLIAAFQATLEETAEADLLIHVVDVSSGLWRAEVVDVKSVLREIGAGDKPTITALNKIDLVDDHYELRRLTAEIPDCVYLSALKRDGLDALIGKIEDLSRRLFIRLQVTLPITRSDLVNLAYSEGHVELCDYTAAGIELDARVPPRAAHKIAAAAISKGADAREDS
jgi:GTP-binding protein HflX